MSKKTIFRASLNLLLKEDEKMFCANCGMEIADDSRFCKECGTPAGKVQAPVAPAPAVMQPAPPAAPVRVRKDFLESPNWAKAVSVIGFALALVTMAFVWLKEMAPFTYGFSAIGLILCILAMATRNRNVFSLVGMIMNIVIVFIGSIQIAILVNPPSIW